MKDTLQPGATASTDVTVDRDRTIGFMGDEGRVYATPAMIADIENLCRDLLLKHADEGEDSVGTRVEIDHLAATPEGFVVGLTATVTKVEGRMVTFAVEGADPYDTITRGFHTRFVVNVAKTLERLAQKTAKAKTA
jgi:fluoroacetyl-CoA thioesterase